MCWARRRANSWNAVPKVLTRSAIGRRMLLHRAAKSIGRFEHLYSLNIFSSSCCRGSNSSYPIPSCSQIPSHDCEPRNRAREVKRRSSFNPFGLASRADPPLLNAGESRLRSKHPLAVADRMTGRPDLAAVSPGTSSPTQDNDLAGFSLTQENELAGSCKSSPTEDFKLIRCRFCEYSDNWKVLGGDFILCRRLA